MNGVKQAMRQLQGGEGFKAEIIEIVKDVLLKNYMRYNGHEGFRDLDTEMSRGKTAGVVHCLRRAFGENVGGDAAFYLKSLNEAEPVRYITALAEVAHGTLDGKKEDMEALDRYLAVPENAEIAEGKAQEVRKMLGEKSVMKMHTRNSLVGAG